jgi:hypothetical protein
MKPGLGCAVALSLVAAAEMADAAAAAVVAAAVVVVVEFAVVVAAVALDQPSTEGYCWQSHPVVPLAAAAKLARYLTDAASSTDAPCGGEAADQNVEHTAKDAPDLLENIADIHTLVD